MWAVGLPHWGAYYREGTLLPSAALQLERMDPTRREGGVNEQAHSGEV